MITLYVLPGKDDQASFSEGARPGVCLVKRFRTDILVAAYLLGMEASAGHLDEYRILEQTSTALTVRFRTADDVNEQDFVFDTSTEKTAFKEGLADGDGFMQPAIYSEDDPHYARLFEMFGEAEFA